MTSHVRLRAVPAVAGLVTALAVILTTAGVASARLGVGTLRAGMSGPQVSTLQRSLTRLGYTTRVDGRYDAGTVRSVTRFERDYGLRTDGVATPAVVRQLRAALSTGTVVTDSSGGAGFGLLASQPSGRGPKLAVPSAPTPNGGSQHLGDRTLREGMKGHDVRVLQGYLTLVGFPTQVDGSFGPSTLSSVEAFQRSRLLTPNGVVTYAVQVVLRQAVAQAISSGAAAGKATINPDGTATAPAGAPQVVQEVIAAANQIIDKPYIYAGGHASWNAPGYDCSGSVSYALHGGGLLSSPEDSTGLESYGLPGRGKWITIYADAAHTWVVVAGIAFDTADYGGPNIPAGTGPRWRTNPTGNLADGGNYVVRHPPGL